jgi:hypothetical protein
VQPRLTIHRILYEYKGLNPITYDMSEGKWDTSLLRPIVLVPLGNVEVVGNVPMTMPVTMPVPYSNTIPMLE